MRLPAICSGSQRAVGRAGADLQGRTETPNTPLAPLPMLHSTISSWVGLLMALQAPLLSGHQPVPRTLGMQGKQLPHPTAHGSGVGASWPVLGQARLLRKQPRCSGQAALPHCPGCPAGRQLPVPAGTGSGGRLGARGRCAQTAAPLRQRPEPACPLLPATPARRGQGTATARARPRHGHFLVHGSAISPLARTWAAAAPWSMAVGCLQGAKRRAGGLRDGTAAFTGQS